MPKTKGRCESCGRVLTKGGMSRHLASCRGDGRHLQVAVAAKHEPYWWVQLAVPPRVSLRTLDRFLRDLWLECCGHLSAFTINRVRYEPDPHDYGWGEPARAMSAAVGEVLSVGATFDHEYDFGTTTELEGRVVGTIKGGSEAIALLARNEPIPWTCTSCEGEATLVCAVCGTLTCDGCGPLDGPCDDCGEYREEVGLPVTNSPRMGLCGYAGPPARSE